MGARQLTRWQKASALVPMAVLVGAWGAALTNSGLATAADSSSPDDIPEVPTTAFEQPASVQDTPPGIDERAGAAGTISTLSTNGIPSAALYAYHRAETLLSKADESCQLPWNLVAAIGRVESNHGRTNGNALSSDGLAEPGIYGIPLDGRGGTSKVIDTDNGALDQDTVYDRAVGPMQFIPGTWNTVGIDSDNDGKKNPQDIDDAATAAGIYLCAGTDDLSTSEGTSAAVHRYNNSDSYTDLVMKISSAYAAGDFSQTPNGYSSASVITGQSFDQSLTPTQRNNAAQAQQKAKKKAADDAKKDDAKKDGAKSSDGGSSSGSGGNAGGSSTDNGGGGILGGGSGGSDGSSSGDSSSGGTSTVGGKIQDMTDDTPLGPVTKPVTNLLTQTEARTMCLLKFPLGPKVKFDQCVYGLTH